MLHGYVGQHWAEIEKGMHLVQEPLKFLDTDAQRHHAAVQMIASYNDPAYRCVGAVSDGERVFTVGRAVIRGGCVDLVPHSGGAPPKVGLRVDFVCAPCAFDKSREFHVRRIYLLDPFLRVCVQQDQDFTLLFTPHGGADTVSLAFSVAVLSNVI